jgi:curved DNA-binding protein CbpA
MSKSINYYKILGVSIFAGEEEIKAGYLRQIKKYHPDTYNGNKKEAENITASINEAYSTLKNADKKLVYDTKYGFDVERKRISAERKKEQKKAQRKANKMARKQKYTAPKGEYAPEQQEKQQAEEHKKTNDQNQVKDEKIKTNIFTKKPKEDVKAVKHTVLTPEQKSLRRERIILDSVIIVLLVIIILLIIFN